MTQRTGEYAIMTPASWPLNLIEHYARVCIASRITNDGRVYRVTLRESRPMLPHPLAELAEIGAVVRTTWLITLVDPTEAQIGELVDAEGEPPGAGFARDPLGWRRAS